MNRADSHLGANVNTECKKGNCTGKIIAQARKVKLITKNCET